MNKVNASLKNKGPKNLDFALELQILKVKMFLLFFHFTSIDGYYKGSIHKICVLRNGSCSSFYLWLSVIAVLLSSLAPSAEIALLPSILRLFYAHRPSSSSASPPNSLSFSVSSPEARKTMMLYNLVESRLLR